LPGRWAYLLRQGIDELGYRWGRRGRARPPAAPPATCRALPLALHAAVTARLVQRSLRERATLNGAVTAALLLAARRRLHGGGPGPLRYFTWADLRPYLQPPPPATTVAGYVAPLRLTLPLTSDAAFWPLARRVSRQIGTAGHRGDKFHAVRLIPATMRRLLRQSAGRMADVAVSYTGAVRFAGGAGALRVAALHAFVSNLPQGPELTASVKLFGDRLVWDIVYLDTDMSARQARTVAGEIVRILAREAFAGET
jgi:hypothetical protein